MDSSRVERYGSWIGLAAGMVLPLAFAPFGFTSIAIGCVAVLILLWDVATPARAARIGFAFGFGAFLVGTHWLYVSLHVYGQAPLLLAIPLMAALMALMAAYTALVGYVVVRWFPTRAWRWLLALPGCWVLAEWLRSWLLSGFPWLSLGYATTDSWLQDWIPVGGVFLASAAVMLSAGALRALADRTARGPALLVLVITWGGALGVGQVGWVQPDNRVLKVSLVQGAVPQDRKWLPEQLLPTMRLYRDLTFDHWDSDLVVWPEAAIPAWRDTLEGFFANMHAEAQQTRTALITGVIEYRPQTNQAFNTIMAMDQGVHTYYKRHLVPFGEYFPVPGFIREWMRLQSLPYSDYTAGDRDQEPLPVAGEHIAASICYEDVFGNEQRSMLPQATLLVNVSNDAWFGESIAPHQHLQIARVRAIEAGRYLLRATNTGLTAVIAPDGHLQEQLEQFRTGVLSATIRPYSGATPYVRFGDGTVVLLCCAGLAVAGVRRRKGAQRAAAE